MYCIGCPAGSASLPPQTLQKAAPGALAEPQAAQKFWPAGRAGATGCGGGGLYAGRGGGGGALWTGAAALAGVPQPSQNRASGARGAPQLAQYRLAMFVSPLFSD